MLPLVHRIAPVLYKLMFMSLTALAAGCCIALIRRLVDKRLSPFWKYAMWFVALAALLLPVRLPVGPSFMPSVQNINISYTDEYKDAQREYALAQQALAEADISAGPIGLGDKVEELRFKSFVFDTVLPAVWLCGAVLFGFYLLGGTLLLRHRVRRTRVDSLHEHRLNGLLDNCRATLCMRRRAEIVLQTYINTPAVLGFFRPRVILPAWAADMTDEHLEYVILHEMSHLRRGDGMVNTLLAVLQTVYWFTPLCWLLFKLVREDMELACDAAVLHNMDKQRQREYSLTLIEVMQSCQHAPPTVTARLLCMAGTIQRMEHRLKMINLGDIFKKRRITTAVSGVLLILTVGALFLTGSAPGLPESVRQGRTMPWLAPRPTPTVQAALELPDATPDDGVLVAAQPPTATPQSATVTPSQTTRPPTQQPLLQAEEPVQTAREIEGLEMSTPRPTAPERPLLAIATPAPTPEIKAPPMTAPPLIRPTPTPLPAFPSAPREPVILAPTLARQIEAEYELQYGEEGSIRAYLGVYNGCITVMFASAEPYVWREGELTILRDAADMDWLSIQECKDILLRLAGLQNAWWVRPPAEQMYLHVGETLEVELSYSVGFELAGALGFLADDSGILTAEETAPGWAFTITAHAPGQTTLWIDGIYHPYQQTGYDTSKCAVVRFAVDVIVAEAL
ncbi:MAG: hypothetical protein FWD16_06215 [Clostridia bacterium]|nr:hypothetical protein [Clostridia bacterium]